MNPLETVDISTQHRMPQRPEAALLAELSCFQRLLLVTDGTVTEMLEQYLQESIQVHKLAEKVETDFDQLPAGHELFVSAQDMPVLKRQVLLQGKTTQQSWLHAESSVLLDHLPQGFRSDLLHSRQPIELQYAYPESAIPCFAIALATPIPRWQAVRNGNHKHRCAYRLGATIYFHLRWQYLQWRQGEQY